jgi:protoporphyrinogen/coproporphyrinogen III oxidase
MKRVVIAGAGIAGLSIARALRKRDPRVDVVVLERHPRTGGNIQTAHVDGYTCESGPDGFLDSAPATLTLVHDLGLGPRLLPSNEAVTKRYVVRDGRLCEVPASLGAFVRTPLLSTRGKLRVAWEPFAERRHDADESIHDFACRRLGHEAASVLVAPMVSGIFAGDATALSLRACFPKMWELEDDHGGLFRALLATRRRRTRKGAVGAPAGRLTSFIGGMSELTDALTRDLGVAIRTSTAALAVWSRPSLRVGEDGRPQRRYTVLTGTGLIDADAVVLSGPSPESAAILQGLDPVLSTVLQGIPAAPLAVVCLGYDTATVSAPCTLDGFGFLVPPGEGMRVLGALWETSIYSHRAPANKTLLRVMIGGARDREAVELPDTALLDIVRNDLGRVMGLRAVPEFVRIVRHGRGIPQYVKGHRARLDQIDKRLQAHPGLYLAGSSYRGVSINACVAEADGIAQAVLRGATDRQSTANGCSPPDPTTPHGAEPLSRHDARHVACVAFRGGSDEPALSAAYSMDVSMGSVRGRRRTAGTG